MTSMRHSTEIAAGVSAPVQSAPGCETLDTVTLAKQMAVRDAAKVSRGTR